MDGLLHLVKLLHLVQRGRAGAGCGPAQSHPRWWVASVPTSLPRDAMHSRPRPLCGLRLYVRPSRSWILSNRINLSSIFLPSGSATIPVFHTKQDCNILTGTPLTGASNTRGYEKIHDLRQISRFRPISEMTQDRAIVTMEGEYETAPKLSNGISLNDLEWPPNPDFKVAILFNVK